MVTAGSASTPRALLRASHPEPGIAVTALAVLLAVSMDASVTTVLLVGVVVFTGQLSIGWSNDLIDVDRDRASGRRDKPIATGALQRSTVRTATGAALALTVVTSPLLGWVAGLLHLGLVAMGWAYNAGFKRTVLSWLPYALAFGLLPAMVSFAATDHAPPLWMPVAGALLGVGAHLINAVPDIDDDNRTGVRGLPHRLGARHSLDLATLLMLIGSVVAVVGRDGDIGTQGFVTLAIVGVLAVAGRLGRGRAPFRAALAIALVDVVALLS